MIVPMTAFMVATMPIPLSRLAWFEIIAPMRATGLVTEEIGYDLDILAPRRMADAPPRAAESASLVYNGRQ